MKITYISHVDWDWIKQRPQFLAEEMAEKCQIVYVYRKVIGQRLGVKNIKNPKIKYKVIYLLPLTRFRIIRKINTWICKVVEKSIVLREKTDIIWTSDCHCTDIFGKNKKVVYEVMDLYGEMVISQKEKQKIFSDEQMMMEKADHVIVTSLYIQEKLQEIYHIPKQNISIIRNGVSLKQKNIKNITNKKNTKGKIKLAYIGTVAGWFDWEKIEYSLEKLSNIEYHIIGPVAEKPSIELPDDRIIFYGSIQHEKLSDIVKDMDILLMPFVVNEIVKAVDPVKLYEYINFFKDIICVQYKEIERFSDFVYFYHTSEEYVDAINKIIQGNKSKYTFEQAEKFLKQNSWEKRAEEAVQVCKELLK
mgnify:CR=1 FL=1